jgi:leader peptidase (prepilin peptidase) / N-methyltransferase
MPDSGILDLDLLEAMWPWIALAFGVVVGSFANVCIHRIPLRRSVVRPRSRCPRCDAPIRPWENVPVLSYLALAGRCRACRAPISARYPLVEAANGAMYFALACTMGPTPRAVVTMVFVTALLVLTLIDYDHQLLPNVITLPGIAVGLAASLLPGPPTPADAALAAAAGYLAFFAVAKVYERTRGIEGLGEGDWKMTAMLGAFLGWQKLLLTVFAATLGGTLVGIGLMAFGGRTSRHALPLGTFLGISGIAVVFVGQAVLDWYRGLLHG